MIANRRGKSFNSKVISGADWTNHLLADKILQGIEDAMGFFSRWKAKPIARRYAQELTGLVVRQVAIECVRTLLARFTTAPVPNASFHALHQTVKDQMAVFFERLRAESEDVKSQFPKLAKNEITRTTEFALLPDMNSLLQELTGKPPDLTPEKAKANGTDLRKPLSGPVVATVLWSLDHLDLSSPKPT